MDGCEHCGEKLSGRRPDARYCDDRCVDRARRRRRRGLPPDAYPDGGRRGRLAMGELTARERLVAEAQDAIRQSILTGELADLVSDVRRELERQRRKELWRAGR